MHTGRISALSGLLALGLWASIVGQAQAQGLEQRVSALESKVATLQTNITTLQRQIAALQSSGALALAPYVSVQTGAINGLTGPHIIFTGANVHVRSGSGFSDDNTSGFLGDHSGTLTGLGNLVIGYDEVCNSFGCVTPTPRHTGSHNLVVGPFHTFSSWGGMVAGFRNTISGSSSSVTGGELNTASAFASTVSGGNQNTASEFSSSVSGGAANTASNEFSSVSGGVLNTASGEFSSAGGGRQNTASGFASSVSGGEQNTANGFAGSVSGGENNFAMGDFSSVSGGSLHGAFFKDNWAAGQFSSSN